MAISRSTGSPSLNLPRDTNFNNTTLLLHGDGTTGANNTLFVDSSGLETFIPFKGTYSIYLPTTSDKISTASSYTFAGVFTLEFFMYIPATLGGAGSTVCGVFTAGGFNIWYDGTRISPNVYGTGNIFNSTFNPSLNTWYHVVVTRNASNLMTMYVNGVSVGSTTTSASYTSGQFSLQYSGGYGYISNVRLTNTDVYGGSVTIPTTSLTSIDGTQFILAQSNRIIDSSTINQTITTSAGTPAISSGGPAVVPAGKPGQGVFSPFATPGWSNYFNGSTDYLTVPTSTNFNLSSNDFTIEGWINPTSTASTATIFERRTSGGFAAGDWVLYLVSSQLVFASYDYDSVGNAVLTSGTISANIWTHFALVRNGSTLSIYINGILAASRSTINISNNSNNLTIGVDLGSGTRWFFPGYISNLRLVNGTALYTSNFTPPLNSLSTVTNTSIIACNNYRFIGANTTVSNVAITTSGSPQVQPYSPFAPTRAYSKDRVSGSVFFNGSSDYLKVTSNNGFAFGTGDYTVECWIYPLDTTSGRRIVEFSDNNDNLDLNVAGAGYISYYNGSTSTSSSSAVVKLNAWNHIASVRSSGTVKVYVNGTVAVTQSTTPNTASARALNIAGVTNVWFNGYISNFRVLKGTALYTSDFTPSTALLIPVANTTLLVNSTNSGIIDQTGKNNIATYGSAAISSTQSKFGGSSISLPGSGSYLVIPYQNFPSIGSGDFTIECWIYFNSLSGLQAIIAKWNQTVGSGEFDFNVSSGTLKFDYGAFSEVSSLLSGGTVTTGQWYHLAVVRSGSTFTQYINGTSTSTATSSATRTVNVNVTLGNYYSSSGTFPATGSTDLNAYIDDLRVTKYARYTANFTPPARKFEDR